MIFRKAISHMTIFAYCVGLNGCKTVDRVPDINRRSEAKPSDSCAVPLQLVRPDVDPAKLVTSKLTFREFFLGDFQQLQINADGLHPDSDQILYYKIVALNSANSFFEDTVPLSEIRIPHLKAGTYRIFAASCVDPGRVSPAVKGRYQSQPTAEEAGFVQKFAVYCGPLAEATNVRGAKAPYLQRQNSNQRLGKLLTAAFQTREHIEQTAKTVYDEASVYHAENRESMQLTGGNSAKHHLADLTGKVSSHGRHGYALLVLSDYEDNVNKTFETLSAPKQAPSNQQRLALDASTSGANSCQSVDDYENTQDSPSSKINWEDDPGAVEDILKKDDQAKSADSDKPTENPADKQGDPVVADDKPPVSELTGEIATAEPLPTREEGKSGNAMGIALLTTGSIVAVTSGGIALLKRQGIIKKVELEETSKVLQAERDALVKKRQRQEIDDTNYRKQMRDIEIKDAIARHKNMVAQVKDDIGRMTAMIENEIKLQPDKTSVRVKSLEHAMARLNTRLEVLRDVDEDDFISLDKATKTRSLLDVDIQRLRKNLTGGLTGEQKAIVQRELDYAVMEKATFDHRVAAEDILEPTSQGGNKRLQEIEFSASVKGKVVQGLKMANNFAAGLTPKFLRGAVAVGVIAVLLGAYTTHNTNLTGASGTEQAFMEKAMRKGASIVRDMRRLNKIHALISEEITFK